MPLELDGSVHVTAQHPHYLRVGFDQRTQGIAGIAVLDVHVGDAGQEWRMVHEERRRAIGGLRQGSVEPLQAPAAQGPARRTGNCGVETDQSHGIALHRIVQELPVVGQVVVVEEGEAQILAIIVIAGNDVDRTLQRSDELPQQAVLFRLPEVHEVPGHEHDVGSWIESPKVLDTPSQIGCGIHLAVRQAAFGLDMGIGNLRDQHAGISMLRITAPPRPKWSGYRVRRPVRRSRLA